MIKRNVAVVAPVAGVLLGVLDFVWIRFVPFPFGELGNSIATWAVAAFLLTFYGRWGIRAGLTGAVLCLVLAVPSYYLAATAIQHDDLANVYATTSLLWMGLAVVAGTVFGAAGVLARTSGRVRDAALAVPASVLFAEAILNLLRIGDNNHKTTSLTAYAILLIVLGVLITTWLSRTRTGIVLLYAVPLTALGTALLTTTGFH
ncbi:hypothetical protein Ate02nite_78330 [Paractinoplanes tereljensis]|uniref:Uncharacterized protein n=1 Tax=Paractinoplanes tereljensis TaxID=571912 RepID=A0A919NUT2_9ACTN|nr:DUF6518 family protein [Actinoplanes tereljensis]GIF25103.1 hypothetical protein Ate02nite_78330 [Actinoplanes tereljensis]